MQNIVFCFCACYLATVHHITPLPFTHTMLQIFLFCIMTTRTPGSSLAPRTKKRKTNGPTGDSVAQTPNPIPDQEFLIDHLTARRMKGTTGTYEYKVHWVGLDTHGKPWADTWEPSTGIPKPMRVDFDLELDKSKDPWAKHPKLPPPMAAWRSKQATAYQDFQPAKHKKLLVPDSAYEPKDNASPAVKAAAAARTGWKAKGTVRSIPDFIPRDRLGKPSKPGCTLPFDEHTPVAQWVSAFLTPEILELCTRQGNVYARQTLEAKKEAAKQLDGVDLAYEREPFTTSSMALWHAIRYLLHGIHGIQVSPWHALPQPNQNCTV
jgi:hypothetical protein